MNDISIEELKKQHFDNYKKSIIEIINNNSSILVEKDIVSLLDRPPLDSMDTLKLKFFDIAKKNELLVNSESIDKYLEEYRTNLLKLGSKIKDIRTSYLIDKVNNYSSGPIRLFKKDFLDINKILKSELKKGIILYFEKYIINNINLIFKNNLSNKDIENIKNILNDYINNCYLKQVINNIDNKVMIKDTILINACKEATNRYLFTLNHSRLLN